MKLALADSSFNNLIETELDPLLKKLSQEGEHEKATGVLLAVRALFELSGEQLRNLVAAQIISQQASLAIQTAKTFSHWEFLGVTKEQAAALYESFVKEQKAAQQKPTEH